MGNLPHWLEASPKKVSNFLADPNQERYSFHQHPVKLGALKIKTSGPLPQTHPLSGSSGRSSDPWLRHQKLCPTIRKSDVYHQFQLSVFSAINFLPNYYSRSVFVLRFNSNRPYYLAAVPALTNSAAVADDIVTGKGSKERIVLQKGKV